MEVSALVTVFLQLFFHRSAYTALQLTAFPKHLHYITGEPITLTCSLPVKGRLEGFIFFKDKREVVYLQAPNQQSQSYTLPHLSVKDNGEYTCKYWKEPPKGSNFPFTSSESNPVFVIVFDRPHPPLFSVSPKRDVYISGESISLMCSAPDEHRVSRILFFKDGRQLPLINPSSPPVTFTHSLLLSPQDNGNYSCMHQVVESGREICSLESSIIRVSVMDLPPQPVLTVDPASGVVKEGGPLLLTCSATRNDTERRVHFYKDGLEVAPINEGLQRGSLEVGDASPETALWIPQAKPNHAGEYACSYEHKWIISPRSQKVNVTVLEPNSSAPVLGYLHSTLPLLILLVPLALCCRREKKPASNRCQESHPAESKEEPESGPPGTLEPQVTPLELQDADVIYALVSFSSAGAPSRPAVESGLRSVEGHEVLYSEILLRPNNRPAK